MPRQPVIDRHLKSIEIFREERTGSKILGFDASASNLTTLQSLSAVHSI
jgi:hypothetical protein